MYIGKRGDKKSVMNHFYYTMKIYIGSYPSEIIGREMLEIADEISSILGCTYEKLGYSLLHPDYYDTQFYYTMKIYIGSYPSEIIGREMLEIADEISSILGCTYEKLGYSLLHPDYYDTQL